MRGLVTSSGVSRSVAVTIRSILALGALLILAGCTTLPENTSRQASFAMTDTSDTQLARQFSKLRADHDDETGFVLLGRGVDAFLARALLAQSAERSIDAQYYLLHDDLTGRLFIDQLLAAADRGVRVRLLVDDMDLQGRDHGARALDSHPNFEVRIFNPFSRSGSRTLQLLTGFGRVTRRMHNKSFSVDNQVTIVGGRNIGNEYFEADPSVDFNDLDVLATGPVTREVTASFDRYWNHPLAYPIATLQPSLPEDESLPVFRDKLNAYVDTQRDGVFLSALHDAPLAHRLRKGDLDLRWGSASVVADDPDKLVSDRGDTHFHLATALQPRFAALQHDLVIFSPYFVPGKQGTEFLSNLARRGIRVRILTNSLASTDVAVVHAGYAKYRKDLLRAGVELFEMKADENTADDDGKRMLSGSSRASLHAKSFVLDHETIFIGSLNLDPRSVVENSEIGILLQEPVTAAEMSDWFDRHVPKRAYRVELVDGSNGSERIRWREGDDADARVFNSEPDASWSQRLLVTLASLLPIESQL